MTITLAQALTIVPLASIKAELRIRPTEVSQDELLSEQIHSAANFVSESTGRGAADLAVVRPAIVSAVRTLYDGGKVIGPNAAFNALMDPFRSYKAG